MKHLIRTSALLTILVAMLTLGLIAPSTAAATTGAVKGVITLDGTPLKGVRIELHHTGDDGFENKTLAVDTTDSKGAYSFTFSVTDPEYSGHTILIKDPSGRIVNTSRAFIDQPGKTVTRNASVEAGSSITGTVKRGDGVATQRLRVNVFGPYALLDRYHETVEQDVYPTYVRAAADGSYAVKGLPSGTYYLEFVDENTTYFAQCYDNILASSAGCDGTDDPDLETTKIPVAAGQNVTVNPQVLSTKGQRISGTVTDTNGNPIKGIEVRATDTTSTAGKPLSTTYTKGTFAIRSKYTTSYRLIASDPARRWAPQWYDHAPTAGAAEVFEASEGQVVTGRLFELKSHAAITATVTRASASAKLAIAVNRRTTGGPAYGSVTVTSGSRTKTVALSGGRATVALTGLTASNKTFTVDYSGSPSTATATKTF